MGYGEDLQEMLHVKPLARCLVQSKFGISISNYNMKDNYSPSAPGYTLV